jgi:hypothetical protein
MSYNNIAEVAHSGALRERIAACAAVEGITYPHPTEWADHHQWQLAASPGWGDAWAYALASDTADPGADEAVITDGMILAAVQEILGGGL